MKRKAYQHQARAVVLNGKGETEMARKSVALEEAHDAIKDIYDVAQAAGSTRSEQLDALNKIIDLCTDEIPELGEDGDDEEDGEDEDEDEDSDS